MYLFINKRITSKAVHPNNFFGFRVSGVAYIRVQTPQYNI
jgi:hypothetical protein